MTDNSSENHSIKDNLLQKRFEMMVEDETAYVEYIINKQGMIFLTHTEVPRKIEGHGIAIEMIELVLQNIQQRGLKLVPMCPVVTFC